MGLTFSQQLCAQVEAWKEAGSPGLTVAHAVELPKRHLSGKERALLDFRVEGPASVVLPPPPQKKKSIYGVAHPHKPSMSSTMSRTRFNESAFEGIKPGLRSKGRQPVLVRACPCCSSQW